MATTTKLMLTASIFLFILFGCQRPVDDAIAKPQLAKVDGPHQCYLDCKDANGCGTGGGADKTCRQECFDRCYGKPGPIEPDKPKPQFEPVGLDIAN